MAINVLQLTGPKAVAPSPSVQTDAFVNPVANGNTIFLFLWTYVFGAAISTVVDTTGANAYVRDSLKAAVADTKVVCEVWRSSNVVGGAGFQITANGGGVNSFITAAAIEVSGLDNAAPLDGVGSTNAGAVGSPPSTGAFSTLNANDLILATFSSGTWIGGDVFVPPGYTVIANEHSIGAFEDGFACYKIVAAPLVGENAVWGANSSYAWSAIGLGYKGAAVPPPASSVSPWALLPGRHRRKK